MRKIMCVLLVFILVTSTIFAGVGDFFRGDSGIFKLDPVYDGIIGGGGILINAGVLVWDHFNGKPHFDGEILDINTVNPFDRWAVQPYSEPLHITGTVTESFAIAFPAVLFATNMSEWGVWATMYAESVLWANGLKEVMKTAVVRERPYMYFEGYPEDKVTDKSGDFARSFPSDIPQWLLTELFLPVMYLVNIFPIPLGRFLLLQEVYHWQQEPRFYAL